MIRSDDADVCMDRGAGG